MEKIKVGTKEYDLVPAGIGETDKSRDFTIKTDAPYSEIEEAFSDVSNILCLSEAGEVLVGFYDGVALKSIKRDYEQGTYTIEVSTDTLMAEIKALKAMIEQTR